MHGLEAWIVIESIQATRTPHREGLFRALLGGVGRPVTELFAEFRQRPAAQLFAENVSRSSQGARIMMDRAHGHGYHAHVCSPSSFRRDRDESLGAPNRGRQEKVLKA